jgi:hypothetical protein
MPIKCCERAARQERHSISTSPQSVPITRHQQTSKILRPFRQSSGRYLGARLDFTIICRILFSYQKNTFRAGTLSERLKMRLCIVPKQARSAKWRSTTRRRTVILTRLITVSGRQIVVYYRNAAFGLSSTTRAASLNYALNH